MNAIGLARIEGLQALETLLNNPTCTYLGQTMPCTLDDLKRGLVLIVGGKEEEINCTLKVRASLLANAPQAQKQITYNGESSDDKQAGTYRIANVNIARGGGHYELDLVKL